MTRLALAVLALALSTSIAHADFGPFNLTCDGGKRFTITFTGEMTDPPDARKAIIVFPNAPPETLQEMPEASGIYYANPRYGYREHQGKTELETMRNGAVASTVTCKPAQ